MLYILSLNSSLTTCTFTQTSNNYACGHVTGSSRKDDCNAHKSFLARHNAWLAKPQGPAPVDQCQGTVFHTINQDTTTLCPACFRAAPNQAAGVGRGVWRQGHW